MELTYDNMMAVVQKYCAMLPGLIPENKHEMEAICTPDCVFSYPDGQTEADHVSSHWETYRAYLHYEPFPLYIQIDERKKQADCVLLEEARHPETGELVKAFKDPVTGVLTEDTIYMRESFQFALHDGKVKIKTVFMGPRIDTSSVAWQRWRDLSTHPKEGIEEGLTYDGMMALVKKYFDMLPGLTPENKHEMEAICTPDCVYSYPNGQTEADHVSAHWEIYRAHCYYEPFPYYINIDERKKMADCVLKEDAIHPVTGKPVKAMYKIPFVGVPNEETVHMREHFEFAIHDGKLKIMTVFMGPRVDVNSEMWKRWRDLSKH